MAAELTPASNATQAVRTNKQALILITNVTVTSGFESNKHMQAQTRLPSTPWVWDFFYSIGVWNGTALSQEHRQRPASRRAVNTSPTNPLTLALRMRMLALFYPLHSLLLSQVRWGVGLDDLGLDASRFSAHFSNRCQTGAYRDSNLFTSKRLFPSVMICDYLLLNCIHLGKSTANENNWKGNFLDKFASKCETHNIVKHPSHIEFISKDHT